MVNYDEIEPVFLDTETTIKNVGEDAIGKLAASPFHPDNKIVWWGHACGDGPVVTSRVGFTAGDEVPLLVAQNVAFDLLHMMKWDESWYEWARTGMVWDTMIVEYLLTGQRDKFISLDKLAERYGMPLKDSRIKEYWDAGVCTTKIPSSEIIPYLKNDVEVVRAVYYKQLKKAKELGMLPLIESQMRARLATICMEHRGMQFDRTLAMSMKESVQDRCEALAYAVSVGMAEALGCKAEQVNPGSPKQISAVLFGGTVEFVEKLPVVDENGHPVYFKSGLRKGQVKTKNTKVPYTAVGMETPTEEVGAAGYHPVGEDILRRYKGNSLVECLLEWRELNKQITTYYDGYSGLVFPDGKIHGNLNHCKTATGRLSSSQPNLQNISNKSMEKD